MMSRVQIPVQESVANNGIAHALQCFCRWLMPEDKTWFLALGCHWMQSLLEVRWPGDNICAQTMWLTRLLAFLQHTTEAVL